MFLYAPMSRGWLFRMNNNDWTLDMRIDAGIIAFPLISWI